MNRSFGRDLEEMDIPIEANIAQRSIGARAMPVATPVTRQASTYSVPAAPPQPISVAGRGGSDIGDLAPVPSVFEYSHDCRRDPGRSRFGSRLCGDGPTRHLVSPAQVTAKPVAADWLRRSRFRLRNCLIPRKLMGSRNSCKSRTRVVAPAAKTDPKVAAIKVAGLGKLKVDLAARFRPGEGKLSPDDGKMVSTVFDEAQELLLDKVEDVRGDKKAPLQGELGDAWWDLINVKTQAMKLSRRSP